MKDNFATYRLKDLPVIVTGGATGIGEQIVKLICCSRIKSRIS